MQSCPSIPSAAFLEPWTSAPIAIPLVSGAILRKRAAPGERPRAWLRLPRGTFWCGRSTSARERAGVDDGGSDVENAGVQMRSHHGAAGRRHVGMPAMKAIQSATLEDVPSLSRLWPAELMPPEQSPPAVLLATIVFFRVAVVRNLLYEQGGLCAAVHRLRKTNAVGWIHNRPRRR